MLVVDCVYGGVGCYYNSVIFQDMVGVWYVVDSGKQREVLDCSCVLGLNTS